MKSREVVLRSLTTLNHTVQSEGRGVERFLLEVQGMQGLTSWTADAVG